MIVDKVDVFNIYTDDYKAILNFSHIDNHVLIPDHVYRRLNFLKSFEYSKDPAYKLEFRTFNMGSNRPNELSTEIVYSSTNLNNDIFRFEYNYRININNNKSEILSTQAKARIYTADKYDNFLKNINNFIVKLKFYFEEKEFIKKRIFKNFHASKGEAICSVTFINKFKKYIDLLKDPKYSSPDSTFEHKFIDCLEKNAQPNIIYNFGIFKFIKKSPIKFKIILCEHLTEFLDLDLYNQNLKQYDNMFDILKPVVKREGGLKMLKTKILKHRLLTE
jgi:hypothetical protein